MKLEARLIADGTHETVFEVFDADTGGKIDVIRFSQERAADYRDELTGTLTDDGCRTLCQWAIEVCSRQSGVRPPAP